MDCLTDKRYWPPASPARCLLSRTGCQGWLAHKTPSLSPSAKTRQGALESLRLALAARLLPDFLLERRLTLTTRKSASRKVGP